jgi:hypothetical protein
VVSGVKNVTKPTRYLDIGLARLVDRVWDAATRYVDHRHDAEDGFLLLAAFLLRSLQRCSEIPDLGHKS